MKLWPVFQLVAGIVMCTAPFVAATAVIYWHDNLLLAGFAGLLVLLVSRMFGFMARNMRDAERAKEPAAEATGGKHEF